METGAVTDLFSQANGILAAFIFGCMLAVRSLAPVFFESALGQRLLPVIPMIVGIAASLAGLGAAHGTISEKVTMGVIAGSFVAHAFKIGKTSVVGSGVVAPTAITIMPKPDPKASPSDDEGGAGP